MKQALVAGGSGFIGSHMVDLLLAKGYHVTVVDSLVTGRATNIADARADFGGGSSSGPARLRVVQADIRDAAGLRLALGHSARFDEIYNLASPASPVDFATMPVFILETDPLVTAICSISLASTVRVFYLRRRAKFTAMPKFIRKLKPTLATSTRSVTAAVTTKRSDSANR